MLRLRLCCVALLLVVLISPAMAWNDAGHMTVALIAYRRLSAEDRAAIAAILREHPHYELFLTKNVPEGVTPDEWAFVKAATWPDFVRPSRGGGGDQFKDRTITRFHRGPWHYITIPYTIGAATTRPTTAPADTEEAGGDVLYALDTMTAELRDPKTVKPERAVAVAWIEHLVGDVHQPLHAASMFSDRFPDGDKGGNDQAVKVEGSPINLHSLWDGLLGTATTYDAIDFLANDITNDPRCEVSKQHWYRDDTTFKSWADESHRLAISFVYLNGRLRTARMADVHEEGQADQVPGLPVSYLANARDLARVRVALAAARLADTLHASLAK